MAIKVGSVVRLSSEYCQKYHVEQDMANSLGLVNHLFSRDGVQMASVKWDDGTMPAEFVRNLEEYRGSVPLATKEEWGLS